AANREKIRDRARNRCAANPEKYRERKRRDCVANLEKSRERDRQYYAANRERYLERKRRYYAANPEKYRERTRRYHAANREQISPQGRAKNIFLRALEEEIDPAALRRRRTQSQRDYDRRALYLAAREELGADFCNAFLDELKHEELEELEK